MRILWVDDHWDTAEEAAAQVLREARQTVEEVVSLKGTRAEVVPVSNAGDGYTLLSEESFDAVVIDIQFDRQLIQWDRIRRAAERRGTPHAIFTSHPKRFDRNPAALALGMFRKNEEGVRGLARALELLSIAPPIRVAHVADLHYDSSYTNGELEEQDALLESLATFLSSERENAGVDLLVFTGDFAHVRPAEDLVCVRSHVQNLIASALGEGRRDGVLVVPGNHDLRWHDFSSGLRGPHPWNPYLDFLSALFQGREDLLAGYPAWDSSSRLLAPTATGDQLTWSRGFPHLNLKAFGFSSSSEDPASKGKGVFRKAVSSRLREMDPKLEGEVRLAICHHNLVASLSLSVYDEKDGITNSGEAIAVLGDSGVDLVLSGHTHATNAFQIASTRLGATGFTDLNQIAVASAGTSGGAPPGGDRLRTFSLIDVGPGVLNGGRDLQICTLTFDSTDRKWKHYPGGITNLQL